MENQPDNPNPSRGVLDEKKKQQIVALVLHGCSRRVAARYVSCSPSTITRTAARDPEFGDQLARAEAQREVGLLRLVQTAAQEPRLWRAAAWLLERGNPVDFAPRPPKTFTSEQVLQIFAEVLAAAQGQQAMEKLAALLMEYEGG